jgi:sugar lactone lactonase YvrE
MPVTPREIRAGERLRTIADDLDHPEAVCWDPDRAAIYAGGEAGQLYRVTLDGRVEVVCEIPGGVLLGLAVDAAGRVFACDAGNGRVWRIEPSGDRRAVGPAMGYPNYLAFDLAGRLWVSDSGPWDSVGGCVWCIELDGSGRRWDVPPLAFANGLAIHEDHLYVVESAAARVVRAPLDGGTPEVVVELPETVPDGLAFDAEGGLWVSCFQPNRVIRLPADGPAETIVDDWSGECVLSPTNIAFAGEDLSTLVLASLCGRTLKAIDAGVAGEPPHRPERSPAPAADGG